MQRQPAPAGAEECLQRVLFVGGGHDIAGVAHEKIGRGNRAAVAVVRADLHADALVLAQQLEQFQAREVHVVIKAAAHQIAVDRSRCHGRLPPQRCADPGAQNCTRLVKPLSATMLAPVMRLAAGLATKTMTRAISSTVPMRPPGNCFKAQS